MPLLINKFQFIFSLDKSAGKDSSNLPHWCQVGESVRIRPYDYTGVIAFLGVTHFSKVHVMAGVTLDMPMGASSDHNLT